MGLHQVIHVYVMVVSLMFSVVLLIVRTGVSLTLLLAFGTLSFPLGCLVQIRRVSGCLLVFCFVLLDCPLLEACSFLKGKGRKHRDGGDELCVES